MTKKHVDHDSVSLVIYIRHPAEIYTRLILGLHPLNDRRRYKVTTSLIGWA